MAETTPLELGSTLKEQGNHFFRTGNYLKAAALYTQAVKEDSSNSTLYRDPMLLESDSHAVLSPLFR